jgi:hypothetical protein
LIHLLYPKLKIYWLQNHAKCNGIELTERRKKNLRHTALKVIIRSSRNM